MSKFLFFFILSCSALAQNELPTIFVLRDKDPTSYDFGDKKKIVQDDVKQSGSPFVTEVLKSLPSLMVVQSGGPGAATSFFIRGTESGHTAVLVDQLKVNDSSSVNRAFNAAFTLNSDIDEVLVLKTPQPVLYGSDAIGGAILFKTRKGPNVGEKPQTLVSVGAGSFSSFQKTIRQDWQTKKNQGTLTGSHYKTMGISRLNKKRVTTSSERDGAEVTSVGSSSVHKWASFESDLLIKFIHAETEYDGYDALFRFSDDKDNRSYNDQYLVQHKTRKKSILGTFQLRQGLNRHQRKDLTGAGSQTDNDGNILTNELTLLSKLGNFEATSGLAYEHETFSTTGLDRSFDLSSAFLHSKYDWNKLSFHAGARADNHSRYGNFSSGSVGVRYSLLSNLDFFTQYAQGMKAPTLYQLYSPATFGPSGNKNLNPEKNKVTEAGFKLKTDYADLRVTAFQNDLDSLIIFPTGVGYVNQGRFIAQGIETNLDAPLGDKFRFQGGYTHQKFLASERPLRRPVNSAVAALYWSPSEAFEFFLRERFISSRFDVDDSFPEQRVKLNAYEVSAVGGKWGRGNLELTLTVENIFDRKYEDAFASSVMPLSFWINISYRL